MGYLTGGAAPVKPSINPMELLIKRESIFSKQFLLSCVTEVWNSSLTTWAFGFTCRDTTAGLIRYKLFTEPPRQYWVWALLLAMDVDTENWCPSEHGCDVSVSPPSMMLRRTTVSWAAFRFQVKILAKLVRMDGWACRVGGLQAFSVHSGFQSKTRKDAQMG